MTSTILSGPTSLAISWTFRSLLGNFPPKLSKPPSSGPMMSG
jgi:hypothetical protein